MGIAELSFHNGFYAFGENEEADLESIFLAGMLALRASLIWHSKLDPECQSKEFEKIRLGYDDLVGGESFRVGNMFHNMFMDEQCRYLHALSTEESLYSIIARDIDKLIPGGSIVKQKGSRDYGTPDKHVLIDGEIRPIEVKRVAFHRRDILQLRRYMTGMGASHGYAMAPKLACKLPKDMTFVKVEPDKRIDKTLDDVLSDTEIEWLKAEDKLIEQYWKKEFLVWAKKVDTQNDIIPGRALELSYLSAIRARVFDPTFAQKVFDQTEA